MRYVARGASAEKLALFYYQVVRWKVICRHALRTATRFQVAARERRIYWLSVSTETLEIPECSIAAMTLATAP